MTHSNGQVDWRAAIWVVGFGGVGGLLSWVWSITVGEPISDSTTKAIAAALVLGMGAGFVGVYVLGNSDTKVLLRTLGFALLCGFSWKPVFEAGQALVTSRVESQAAHEALATVQADLEAVDTASGKELAVKLAQLEASSQELLKTRQHVSDRRIRRQIDDVVGKAIVTIDEMADEAPVESARALGSIAATATLTDRSQFTGAAAESLTSLVERQDFDPAVAAEVSNALLQLGRAAKAVRDDAESTRFHQLSREIYAEALERAPQRGGDEAVRILEERSDIHRELPGRERRRPNG
ncbi:MAG: hypothetical protein OEM62_06020 [Acidobacteriota bacterium]|nr:hypothetical protein [Acidobacteriota bacterium]